MARAIITPTTTAPTPPRPARPPDKVRPPRQHGKQPTSPIYPMPVVPQRHIHHARHNLDLRDMLLLSGIGQYNAVMSIPYMNFLPRTTDPYAQGVIQLVQGLQRLLNKCGASLEVDGGMGDATVTALMPFSGPCWYDKSWAQLYSDVIACRKWQGWERIGRPPPKQVLSRIGMTGMGDVTDVLSSPLLWIAGGALVYWKWFR